MAVGVGQARQRNGRKKERGLRAGVVILSCRASRLFSAGSHSSIYAAPPAHPPPFASLCAPPSLLLWLGWGLGFEGGHGAWRAVEAAPTHLPLVVTMELLLHINHLFVMGASTAGGVRHTPIIAANDSEGSGQSGAAGGALGECVDTGLGGEARQAG